MFSHYSLPIFTLCLGYLKGLETIFLNSVLDAVITFSGWKVKFLNRLYNRLERAKNKLQAVHIKWVITGNSKKQYPAMMKTGSSLHKLPFPDRYEFLKA